MSPLQTFEGGKTEAPSARKRAVASALQTAVQSGSVQQASGPGLTRHSRADMMDGSQKSGKSLEVANLWIHPCRIVHTKSTKGLLSKDQQGEVLNQSTQSASKFRVQMAWLGGSSPCIYIYIFFSWFLTEPKLSHLRMQRRFDFVLFCTHSLRKGFVTFMWFTSMYFVAMTPSGCLLLEDVFFGAHVCF